MTEWEARDSLITSNEAELEIQKHDASWEEFLNDVGRKEEYEGSEILDWLGY